MGAWGVVYCEDDMNVIINTWDFKLKRYPDGIIKIFKARLCARGDMQLKGIYFFDNYTTVVQWTTSRLMIIIEVLLQFKPKQGDITATIIYVKLEENKNNLLRYRNYFISMINVES